MDIWICAHDAQRVSHSLFLCSNINRIIFEMLVSFRRRLSQPFIVCNLLVQKYAICSPMRHRSHHFVFFFFFFLGPLVGRRSSLFRSNSPFRFPLITYGSYINPFELLLSSAFISRWKYQFSSDHWSQATSSVVSTWMGDRLGTPRNADIFCLFFIFDSIDLKSSFSIVQ